jgi:hypothetical protein
MWRTELIPQTKAPINKGKVYYHFSMMRKDKNAPSVNHEHQVNFFESHFTEMKYGWISKPQDIREIIEEDTDEKKRWRARD